MPEHCAECGAVLPEGMTCQAIFDEVLSLEYANSAYGQVHFLTVACFMIQHRRYSNEALAWIQEKLQIYLDQQLTGQQLRRLIANETNGATRTWKIIRQADATPLPQIAWSMTIADIAQCTQNSEVYCAQVKHWARTILQNMQSVH